MMMKSVVLLCFVAAATALPTGSDGETRLFGLNSLFKPAAPTTTTKPLLELDWGNPLGNLGAFVNLLVPVPTTAAPTTAAPSTTTAAPSTTTAAPSTTTAAPSTATAAPSTTTAAPSTTTTAGTTAADATTSAATESSTAEASFENPLMAKILEALQKIFNLPSPTAASSAPSDETTAEGDSTDAEATIEWPTAQEVQAKMEEAFKEFIQDIPTKKEVKQAILAVMERYIALLPEFLKPVLEPYLALIKNL